MKHSFFIDETGDHGLNYVDKNFPLFLLCGVLVAQESLLEIEKRINSFKRKFFNTANVILHSREIRKCEGAFQILFDLNIKKNFYQELNAILAEADYRLIASAVNKEEHIKKYGKGARDPYALSLSFIVERMIFCLDTKDSNSEVKLFAEQRGRREDSNLLAHFNSLADRGTYFVTVERMKQRVKSFSFRNKRENVVGLQIADLCAYPLARHLLSPEEPYIPFKIIEEKIYCDNKGDYNGWGLKVFP